MTAIPAPLIAAGLVTAFSFAAISLLPRGEGEMEGNMLVRFLLGPLCLAVVILVLDGVADHLYLVGWLHP